MALSAQQAAQSFSPAHPDLSHAAGLAAQVGSESYVEALAREVFYWGYPGVDTFGRTNMWQIMDGRRGSKALRHAPRTLTGSLRDQIARRGRASPLCRATSAS
jgi:hypothetical protein